MPSVKGIHHVCLRTSGMENFRKTVDFYQNVLGLPYVRQWSDDEKTVVMLSTGQGIIEITSQDNTTESGSIPHFALSVDNVDEFAAMVEKEGYNVYLKPKDVEMNSEDNYKVRIAFFIGPVGEKVELFYEY